MVDADGGGKRGEAAGQGGVGFPVPHSIASGVRRRESILGFLALACAGLSPHAGAQPREKLRHIGFLNPRGNSNELDAAFLEGMRALGHVEERTIRIEYRWGANSDARAEALARELVARGVEVIVTATTLAVRAAMRATTKIPIVMAASADPVGSGLVASLARPGGNVTGLTLISTDTAAKRLELLRDLVPSATRVATLFQGSSSPGSGDQVNALLIAQLQTAARQLGLSLAVRGVGSEAEIAEAFEAMRRESVQALIVQASQLTIDNRARIAELAARHRIPAMYETEVFAAAGGLMSYGPSLADMYRRAAGYVDKILKGAKAADLPVELPIKYELVINLKAAKTLGQQIPSSLLLRADRVFE
jgi:putative ABC transport system substrate-binding protein